MPRWLQRGERTRKFQHWSTTTGRFMNASIIIPLRLIVLAQLCIYLPSPLVKDPPNIRYPDMPHICSHPPSLLHLKTLWTQPFTGRYFFRTWRVLGSSVGRISGESEGVVKVLTDFSEATEMAAWSRSGTYRYLLCGGGLSSMVMGGRCIAGLPKSAVNGLLKQS